MPETFPRKPLLDRIIVREIPIAEFYEQPEGVDIDLDNVHIKERSDRGVVVAVGDCVSMGNVTLPMPVAVDDIVFFDEFALTDPVYLNPAHKLRHDLPRYFQIRVADLKGVDVENRNRIVDAIRQRHLAESETTGVAN
jgi:co-chaperonin GroES (HSP10)